MTDYAAQRVMMLELLTRTYGITDKKVIEAMMAVPREEFVSEEMKAQAYADSALPIEEGQTISQPYIVALMLEAMTLSPGHTILDIGTGSGYLAAVASRIVSKVYTIERHASLVDIAKSRFERLGYTNIETLYGDGIEGWKEHAPYDAIVASAASEEVPLPLLEQLVVGGRLVMPLESVAGSQQLVLITKKNDHECIEQQLEWVRFVPLLPGLDDD